MVPRYFVLLDLAHICTIIRKSRYPDQLFLVSSFLYHTLNKRAIPAVSYRNAVKQQHSTVCLRHTIMSRSHSARSGRVGVQGITGSNSSLTEKYRRNGKLQSCEPCRKSKLRCDHVVPACGRCVKRGKTSSCFYHPNPLTQQVRFDPMIIIILIATHIVSSYMS